MPSRHLRKAYTLLCRHRRCGGAWACGVSCCGSSRAAGAGQCLCGCSGCAAVGPCAGDGAGGGVGDRSYIWLQHAAGMPGTRLHDFASAFSMTLTYEIQCTTLRLDSSSKNVHTALSFATHRRAVLLAMPFVTTGAQCGACIGQSKRHYAGCCLSAVFVQAPIYPDTETCLGRRPRLCLQSRVQSLTSVRRRPPRLCKHQLRSRRPPWQSLVLSSAWPLLLERLSRLARPRKQRQLWARCAANGTSQRAAQPQILARPCARLARRAADGRLRWAALMDTLSLPSARPARSAASGRSWWAALQQTLLPARRLQVPVRRRAPRGLMGAGGRGAPLHSPLLETPRVAGQHCWRQRRRPLPCGSAAQSLPQGVAPHPWRSPSLTRHQGL